MDNTDTIGQNGHNCTKLSEWTKLNRSRQKWTTKIGNMGKVGQNEQNGQN